MTVLQNLPDHLRSVLHALADAFEADGADLALVGGPVRDLLLARDVTDLDLTTDAVPERIKRLGGQAGASAGASTSASGSARSVSSSSGTTPRPIDRRDHDLSRRVLPG